MGKIMVLTVSDNEEMIFQRIQEYLQMKVGFQMIEPETNMIISFPPLEIDLYNREIRIMKKRIIFTDLEFRLLLFLAKNPGQVFTYQQIYEAVWGEEYAYEKGNIMSHIRHVREKIEEDPKNPRYIENVRGVGYRFKKQ